MGSVYCLYSTEDGVPRYVGRATEKVSYRFKQHVTAALEFADGPTYDWMREVWRRGFDVSCFTLQDGIIPADLDMFERYWIEQFANLLNLIGNKGRQTNSPVAKEVTDALQRQIEESRHAPLTSA